MATYSNYLTGGVDELRFYKGACTDEEILTQFTTDGGVVVVAPTDMVAWWRMNDLQGAFNRVEDSSVNNLAVYANLELDYEQTGQIDKAISFQNSRRLGPAISPLLKTPEFSISFWVKTAAIDNGQAECHMTWCYSGGTGYFVEIIAATGIVRFALGNGAGGAPYVCTSTSNVLSDTWRMITITYDGSTASLYIDAALESSSGASYGIAGIDLTITSRTTTRLYTGMLDDYRMFNRAITPDEIAKLYSYTYVELDELIAHWKLDGATTTMVDQTVYGNDIVASAGVTLEQPGQSGLCVDVQFGEFLGGSVGTIIYNTSEFSVSFWVNSFSIPADVNMAWAYNPSTDVGYYVIIEKATGLVSLQLGNGTALPVAVTSTTDVIDQTWHMITVTYAAGVADIYIDAVLEDSASGLSFTPPTNSAFEPTSRGGGETASQYTGKIDEYRVWRKKLTLAQVTEVYIADGGV